MNKANHQVNIVRLGEPRVHPNADSLELFDIGEYQVVAKKGQFKSGDFGVYIQPDSVVPQTAPFKFIWEAYEGLDGTVPEKRRRITVRKFRQQWSEGLLMPLLEVLPATYSDVYADQYQVGQDVSDLLGVTHYDPDKGKELASDAETFKKQRSKYPRSLKGWWYLILHKLGIYTSGGQNHGFDNEDGLGLPVFDVEAFKHYKDVFEPGEMVEVTEKIHGSNGRFAYLDGHLYAGSRTQWKAENANCVWRNVLKTEPWITEWCQAHPGYAIYGECTPTQGTNFQYGNPAPQFFAFDIRTPEGKWMNTEETKADIGFKNWVPVLYTGPFDWEIISKLIDGPSTVFGAKNIREGIVIRPVKERHVRGLGRLILKVVSNTFLEKDNK